MARAGVAGVQAERTAFTMSRLMEYFTQAELRQQIGHDEHLWKAALVKELVDNALDACEAARVPPEVSVSAPPGSFTVSDNGPGIPPEVVRAAADFTTRTSTNTHHRAPTRGRLGNALKCVIAAPAVLLPGDPGAGVTVTARGVRHCLRVAVDRLAQLPEVLHREGPAVVQPGTSVTVSWPGGASYPGGGEEARLYNGGLDGLLASFALLNPGASFTLDGRPVLPGPTPAVPRWAPADGTSPHWYDADALARLIAAHVLEEREGRAEALTVRAFVSRFHGLKRTAAVKGVLERAGLSGMWLSALASGGGIDPEVAARLLAAMREAATPPKPEALGWAGRAWRGSVPLLPALTGRAAPDMATWRYKKVVGADGGVPFVVEAALCVHSGDGRRVVSGLNWTPSLGQPFPALEQALEEAQAESDCPVLALLHVVTPGARFADRGKSNVSWPDGVEAAVGEAVGHAASAWLRAKKQEQRSGRRAAREIMAEARRQAGMTVKEAAFRVMGEAHRHVTGGVEGAPADARQIMYRARKLIQALVGSKCWKSSNTFTQKYLPEFIAANPAATAGWNVVYHARGEMIEPHGGRVVPLGTKKVREYVRSLGGRAPGFRFLLLVEKQGFEELFRESRIADRFDVALAWTKGMSTTASRELVDELSGLGVTTLVLHDFDKAGLSIAWTLRNDSSRYRFRHGPPRVRDIGLRLEDAVRLGLDGESVAYRKAKRSPRAALRERGASEQEAAFLVSGRTGTESWAGRRVELNELTNAQFIEYVEAKLREAGAAKLVPPEGEAREAFGREWRAARVEAAAAAARARAEAEAAGMSPPAPEGLAELIRSRIEGTATSWRECVKKMASDAA